MKTRTASTEFIALCLVEYEKCRFSDIVSQLCHQNGLRGEYGRKSSSFVQKEMSLFGEKPERLLNQRKIKLPIKTK